MASESLFGGAGNAMARGHAQKIKKEWWTRVASLSRPMADSDDFRVLMGVSDVPSDSSALSATDWGERNGDGSSWFTEDHRWKSRAP